LTLHFRRELIKFFKMKNFRLLEEIINTLPEEPLVEEVYIGPFDTVVKSLRWGIASTFRDPCSRKQAAWVRGSGGLIGKSAREIAGYALSDRLLEASLGMATVNSLLDLSGFDLHDVNASDIILGKGKNKNVVVVGDFPFLEKIRPQLKNLWVINKPPWEGGEGVKEAGRFLPRAEVAALSASSFINRTAESLLSLCPRAYTIILGPTAPLSPILFQHGVDAISGALVENRALALPCIWQGSSFRRIAGLRLVTVFNPDRS
jgi:uncharacterized protein (DUF4213/DUF364 family)